MRVRLTDGTREVEIRTDGTAAERSDQDEPDFDPEGDDECRTR
jgi:hypothetical protein